MKLSPIARSRIKKRRRKPKAGDDPKYLAFVRTLPCAVCVPGAQRTITEAAHVGRRGFGQKCADKFAIPLCPVHHRTGPLSHHVLGKGFQQYHGISFSVIIATLNKRYSDGKFDVL